MSVVLDTLRAKQSVLLDEKKAAEASLKEVETKRADITASLAAITADLSEIETAIAEKPKGDVNGQAT